MIHISIQQYKVHSHAHAQKTSKTTNTHIPTQGKQKGNEKGYAPRVQYLANTVTQHRG